MQTISFPHNVGLVVFGCVTVLPAPNAFVSQYGLVFIWGHGLKVIIARRLEGPKVMTVTGMATLTPAIQVTVSTFHNCNKIQGSRSDDSYRDGDADPHGPCDC